MSRDSSFCIATMLLAGRSGLDSRQELGIFLFAIAFRKALGPTHLLSNGYWGIFPWGWKGVKRRIKLEVEWAPFNFNTSRCTYYRLSRIRPHGLLWFKIYSLKLMNLFGQLVGLLRRGIGPMQGLYLHGTTQHRKKNADTHPLNSN